MYSLKVESCSTPDNFSCKVVNTFYKLFFLYHSVWIERWGPHSFKKHIYLPLQFFSQFKHWLCVIYIIFQFYILYEAKTTKSRDLSTETVFPGLIIFLSYKIYYKRYTARGRKKRKSRAVRHILNAPLRHVVTLLSKPKNKSKTEKE